VLIFGARRDEKTENWGNLHNQKLRSVDSSHNIVTVIKSRGRRREGDGARTGDKINA